MWNQRRNSAVVMSPESQRSRNIWLTGCRRSGRQTKISCLMILASVSRGFGGLGPSWNWRRLSEPALKDRPGRLTNIVGGCGRSGQPAPFFQMFLFCS